MPYASPPPNRWLRALPLVIVGGIEVSAWVLDPLGVHAALNDGAPMSLVSRVAAASVNGGVWLLLAKALSSCDVGALGHFFAPFAVSFTMNQWLFWWWPYLLGQSAGLSAMISEHIDQLKGQPRMLPAIGDNLVPTIEHTILQPLSVLALLRVVSLLKTKQRKSTSKEKKWFVAGAVLFSSINIVGLGMAIRDGGFSNAAASALVAGQVLCGNYYLWTTCVAN